MIGFTRLLAACHRLAFSIRFQLRSWVWQKSTARPRPTNPTFVVSGYFNETLGIGRGGQLVANALEASGLTVIREDLRPFDKGLLTRRPQSFPEASHAQVWLMEANAPENKIALFTHNYKSWKDLYRIAVWHWESSLVPYAWLKTIVWFHEIWVTSVFVKEALSAALIKAGMDDQIYKLKLKPLPAPLPATPLTPGNDTHVRVVTLFDPRSHFERKNPSGVIAAWLMAIPEPGPACLIIKALDHATDYREFQDLIGQAQGRADILFICETLSIEDTDALIGSCDILISLHRAEGFGLTLAEAMAHGLGVIATGWSGNMQFMTPENSLLIPYHLVPATARYNGPEAQWAEPDIEAAAKALSKLINDKDLRIKLGTQARKDIVNLSKPWLPGQAFQADNEQT